jgi:hypothetical protein
VLVTIPKILNKDAALLAHSYEMGDGLSPDHLLSSQNLQADQIRPSRTRTPGGVKALEQTPAPTSMAMTYGGYEDYLYTQSATVLERPLGNVRVALPRKRSLVWGTEYIHSDPYEESHRQEVKFALRVVIKKLTNSLKSTQSYVDTIMQKIRGYKCQGSSGVHRTYKSSQAPENTKVKSSTLQVPLRGNNRNGITKVQNDYTFKTDNISQPSSCSDRHSGTRMTKMSRESVISYYPSSLWVINSKFVLWSYPLIA